MWSTQLARKYKLPVRTGGMLSGSKIADAQAAYECIRHDDPDHAWPAPTSCCIRPAGSRPGSPRATASSCSTPTRSRMLQHIRRRARPLRGGLAMEAIREVGPGGHYLGCAHTQRNFKTAFYTSPLADNNSYEQWEAEGATRRQPPRHRARPASARELRAAAARPRHRRGAPRLHRSAASPRCPTE